MRRARPTFVVEYKGDRRQKRPLKGSIWGDTDFRFLAREIEADLGDVLIDHDAGAADAPASVKVIHEAMSHAVAHEAKGSEEARPLGTTPGREPVESFDRANEVSGTPVGHAKSEDSTQLANDPKATIVPETGSGSAPSVMDRQLRPALGRSEDTRPDASKGFVTRAALAALDVENARLKTLLVRKLKSENVHLHAMLKRFLP